MKVVEVLESVKIQWKWNLDNWTINSCLIFLVSLIIVAMNIKAHYVEAVQCTHMDGKKQEMPW